MPTKVDIQEFYAESILSSSSLGSEMAYNSDIKLLGGSNEALKGPSTTLDGSNEESFTLDTFDALIRAAYAKRKGFILARVTTEDPHDPSKLYHSYYAAHHINKVMFRTQPELGLLHRMKSKNPLNNMVIVGDVDYFIVDVASVERSLKHFHIASKKVQFGAPTKKKVNLHQRTHSDLTLRHSHTHVPESLERELKSFQESLISSSGSSNKSEQVERKIHYEATFIGSDDDYLMKTELREVFKANSVNPDDYLLFTLFMADNQNPLVIGPDGEVVAGGRQRPRRPPSSWKNLFGCINTRATPSLTNRYTGLLTSRGLAIFFLLYITGTIVTLKYLVPLAYIYLSGFLFAFVFILVLILFAEAG